MAFGGLAGSEGAWEVVSVDLSAPERRELRRVAADTPESLSGKARWLREVFPRYRDLALDARGRLLSRAAVLCYERREQLIELLAREVGKPITEGHIELYCSLGILTAYAGPLLRKYARRSAFFDPIQRAVKSVRVLARPRGPLLVIGPYNNPLMTPLAGIAAGLAAGAPVLFKPSEHTPALGLAIEELLRDAASAELPADMRPFALAIGARDVGERLAGQLASDGPDSFDGLIFTGSNAVGEMLYRKACAAGKPATCEMGGKDPLVILDDHRSNRLAAKAAAAGSLIFNGQTCAAFERVYVPRRRHDAFVTELLDVLSHYRTGGPLEVASHLTTYIDRRGVEKVKARVDDALARGATLARGQALDWEGYVASGYAVDPIVLTGVDHTMDVMREETFGAVIPVMAVDSDDEALRLARDSTYGLTAAIFTARGAARADELADHFGTVYVNDFQTTWTDKAMAWGGRKRSGEGPFLGGVFDSPPFTEPSTICVDRFPGLTNPYWEKKNGRTLEILGNLMTMRFGRGPARLAAALALPRHLLASWRGLYFT